MINHYTTRAIVWLFFVSLVLILPACRWPFRRTAPSYVVSRPTIMHLPTSSESGSLSAKPRILIFASMGGGGHISAANAISSYLGDAYEIRTVNVISEVLGNFDPFRYISANAVNAEDIYNFCLRHGMSRTVHAYCSLGGLWTSLCSSYVDTKLGEFIDQTQPDLIISVMPFVNGAIYRATQQRAIPFAVITCDLNTSNYVQDLFRPDPALFRYGIPFDDPRITGAIEHAEIAPSSIRVVGFPIRSSFFVMRDKQQLRLELSFPQDKPVIMILMGAAGGRSVLSYLRKLIKVKLPFHVVVCIGRNESLKTCIENMHFPEYITVSIIGFTSKIAELMQASDILITKPGPTSMCEALYAQIPLLLDYTVKPFFWEEMNVDFVLRHGFGTVITSLRHVPLQIKRLLEHPEEQDTMREAMKQFILPDVSSKIRTLVEELLAQRAQESQPIH